MREAIVVLNGSDEEASARAEAALGLQDKLGIDLIASGGFTDERIVQMGETISSRHNGVFLSERSSRDTIGNALWTQTDVLAGAEYSRLVLVTSDYHIDRARWIFSTVTRGVGDIGVLHVPTYYSPSNERRLETKERLLTAAAGLILSNIDLTSVDGYDTAKGRVKRIFRTRYKSTS